MSMPSAKSSSGIASKETFSSRQARFTKVGIRNRHFSIQEMPLSIIKDGMGRNGMGRDGTGRDRTERNGAGAKMPSDGNKEEEEGDGEVIVLCSTDVERVVPGG
ncbi:S ribonuclease [Pyrus ussuriensis x Pyrus communis]|uniref:S ribonuclease n=1 Tax=Pyrus ussuriensis x Pyrus communis TaxID=2448454 RepID=A0A5N5H3P3_9ROSA|nr:S ribonuclease [Pyrus ussuriensis x Pyrus communis]